MAKANKLTMADIGVGDKLRLVTHDVPSYAPNGMGAGIKWDNSWTDSMKEVPLGTIGTVRAVRESGVRFSDVVTYVGWPLTAFELVRNKKKVYK